MSAKEDKYELNNSRRRLKIARFYNDFTPLKRNLCYGKDGLVLIDGLFV
jgi:hypothetical protein